jgi:hypothetical protein
MIRTASLFSQLLRHFPRNRFQEDGHDLFARWTERGIVSVNRLKDNAVYGASVARLSLRLSKGSSAGRMTRTAVRTTASMRYTITRRGGASGVRVLCASSVTEFVLAAILPGCFLTHGKPGAEGDDSGGEVDNGAVGSYQMPCGKSASVQGVGVGVGVGVGNPLRKHSKAPTPYSTDLSAEAHVPGVAGRDHRRQIQEYENYKNKIIEKISKNRVH